MASAAAPSPLAPRPRRADALPSISALEHKSSPLRSCVSATVASVASANQSEDSLIVGTMAWNKSVEIMLAKWCDEAKCFEWMHSQLYLLYDHRSKVFSISSAILNALSGFTNVVMGGEYLNGFKLSWIFGGLSIVISIVGILQDKLAYSRLASEHRQFSIQWNIVRRKIEEELGIPPESRKECATFLKYIRGDINTVSMEGNPQLPEWVRVACFQQFKDVKDFDLPDICGDMEHTRIYERHIVEQVITTT